MTENLQVGKTAKKTQKFCDNYNISATCCITCFLSNNLRPQVCECRWVNSLDNFNLCWLLAVIIVDLMNCKLFKLNVNTRKLMVKY